MKRLYFILSILTLNLVSASECSITNLGSCLVEKFFEYVVAILNAPLQPLLTLTYNLLTEPVNISLFSEIWGIIIYILSLFYGLLLLYAGFSLVISGHSIEKRERAKANLANTIIMMILVQSSYFIYSLAIELFSSVTSVIFNMIPKDFFLLTVDNFSDIGIVLILLIPYLITIVITLIILALRYLIVSAGVIFFAIGIFFYFIEPLNSYGKLIINFLFATMSATLFYAIIFLASAKLLEVTAFNDFKILVTIAAFTFVDVVTIFLAVFVTIKAALKVAKPVMKIVSIAQAV
jgi:hypothetical protein